MPTTTITLPNGVLTLSVSARTDVGRVRSVNEDSVVTAAPLFAVADGMGGHERGDLASRMAVETLESFGSVAVARTIDEVFGMVVAANDAVCALDTGGGLSGTTLTGIVLAEPDEPSHDDAQPGDVEWALFNVGDSRVYRWDGESLAQLTVDHSAVQELVNAGFITKAQAEEHPDRNVITRALGADESVDVDVWIRALAPAETFLICSDGLTKELSDDSIALLFARRGSKEWQRESFASLLVQEAIDAGGHDNVSAIVIDSEFVRS